MYQAMGRDEEARECFRDVLESYPASRPALLGMHLGDPPAGRVEERSKIERAVGDLFERDVRSQASLWCRSAGSLSKSNREGAKALYREAWELCLEYQPALWSWQRESALSEDWEQVAAAFGSAADNEPDHARAAEWFRMAAFAMLRAENLPAAISCARSAYNQDKDSEAGFVLYRHLLRATGDSENLRQVLAARLPLEELPTKKVEVLGEWAEIEEQVSKERAAALWRELATLDPGHPGVLFSLGRQAALAGDEGLASRSDLPLC